MVPLWTLWLLIRVMSLQLGEIAYISEVNSAKKVKSDAQVATNKNSNHGQKLFL